MSTKSIIVTSSGLKNINLNKFTDEDYINLIFGKQEIRMNRIFAEFISPVISRLHKSDPTIDSIKFDDFYGNKADEFNTFTQNILTEDIISIVKQISNGITADINDVQASKLRFLSIILGNEELFNQINQLFPPDLSSENLDTYLECLQNCYYFSRIWPDFDFSSLINYISENFYSIDPHNFLKLPHLIQYYIISNPHLQISTEDSLLDLVLQIINDETFSEENYEGQKIDQLSFLEQIEFTGLSEKALGDFLSQYDFNLTTNSLWRKFYECFFIHFGRNSERIDRHHSKKELFEYKENVTDRFDGIFHYLTEKFKGNVDEKNICHITSSSVLKNYLPTNVVDYKSVNKFFSTIPYPNSWIKFDFVCRKVHVTHYSIKSAVNPKNDMHLKNWVIEGSNNDGEWDVLDIRTNDSSLNNSLAENTFLCNKDNNGFYRYIRLRQNGPNWRGNHQLVMDRFELFGSIV